MVSAAAVLALVWSAPAPEPDEPDDEDLPRGASLPGAETETRGDVGSGVASGSKEAGDFRPWEVGGFVDLNYAFNHNLPDSHVNRGTAGQPRTGEFTVNLAVAYIRRDAIPGVGVQRRRSRGDLCHRSAPDHEGGRSSPR